MTETRILEVIKLIKRLNGTAVRAIFEVTPTGEELYLFTDRKGAETNLLLTDEKMILGTLVRTCKTLGV